MNIDPTLWNIICGIVAIASVTVLSAIAWWCKSMNDSIKELEKKEQETQVFISELRGGSASQKQLQDERWENLKDSMRILQSNVQALVLAAAGLKNLNDNK